jgi:hypothetical protein
MAMSAALDGPGNRTHHFLKQKFEKINQTTFFLPFFFQFFSTESNFLS